ncbi:MAG: YifB family Mg chelatase-like AAA ATPase [bacterium]|nr:YifB family Mg chelatase-like AAA ATPase [bacterium]
MLARAFSVQQVGLSADIVVIETDATRGIPSFSMIGLAEKGIQEAKDRIFTALTHSALSIDKDELPRKIVISLAPAHRKKEGSHFDVAIALSYLKAAGCISYDEKSFVALGELALSGEILPVPGIFTLTATLFDAGFTTIIVPEINAPEASLVSGMTVLSAKNLDEVITYAHKGDPLVLKKDIAPLVVYTPSMPVLNKQYSVDFAHVKGHEVIKRGLEIAAAGRHNVALYGPPGTGKSMLAKAFISILPPLSTEEALEVTRIYSSAGNATPNLMYVPPFRSPHHSASHVSVIGGGSTPRPGEITLAHRGVLFLDEFPEFDRRVIETLRQPIEDGFVHITRAKASHTFPSNFQLIVAFNPCPCGFRGSGFKECTCSQSAIAGYERKLSGPIVDRIDIWLPVPHIEYEELSSTEEGESSQIIRDRISKALDIQRARFNFKTKTNADLSAKEIETHASLALNEQKLLNVAANKLKLSPRSYHRVIKVARSIADLANAENIESEHLLEALQYRPK